MANAMTGRALVTRGIRAKTVPVWRVQLADLRVRYAPVTVFVTSPRVHAPALLRTEAPTAALGLAPQWIRPWCVADMAAAAVLPITRARATLAGRDPTAALQSAPR